MNHEIWWLNLKELDLEKKLKEKMKTFDPAKTDFSEEFFKNLHDKIMAQIPTREVLPRRKPKSSRQARKKEDSFL